MYTSVIITTGDKEKKTLPPCSQGYYRPKEALGLNMCKAEGMTILEIKAPVFAAVLL